MDKIKLENGEYYHIYNRGVEKRDVFLENADYERFLKSIIEFNNIKPIGSLYVKEQADKVFNTFKGVKHLDKRLDNLEHLVAIIAFCLNPNYYHFILKQLAANGISEFMKRINGGYTNYFNKKYNRVGSLF